jgi:N-methylhydantoinase A
VQIATDVGGTFTDFVVLEGGRLSSFKRPSTPEAPDMAVSQGMEGFDLESLAAFSHGTTVATNTVLQRSGAVVALVTTAGFEDLLEIGRQTRPSVYDLRVERPIPITPRGLRFGVRERVSHDGSVIVPLEEEEVSRACDNVADSGAEAVAVCLLHSYANPSHEQAIGRALRGRGMEVSLSSEARPVFREVERASTTSLDAHVRPVVRGYLQRLSATLEGHGLGGFLVMGSHGGVLPDAVAAERPARLLLSGPAGGVIAAAALGAMSGEDRLFTFDMGGTSTDVSAVVDGMPLRVSSSTVAGLTVGLPTIDVVTVGAGGGSHVWVDPGGALRVGPQSAGASPGPAFYGLGGEEATVTDCHVLSGTLPLDFLDRYGLAGNEGAARAACEVVADEASLDLEGLLLGARRVADATMERAFRVLLAGRGLDPRDFTLVAFGGAGPLHAATLAASLGFRRVVVPRVAGAFSALGIALSDLMVERDRTLLVPVEAATDSLGDVVAALGTEAEEELVAAGIDPGGAARELEVDMRYRGQSHELTVPFAPEGPPTSRDFHDAHRASYGHDSPGEIVELVNVRVRLRLPGPRRPVTDLEPSGGIRVREHRRVLFEGGWSPTPAIARGDLGPGHVGEGPTVIEGEGETCLVPPGFVWSVDGRGNLWLEAAEEGVG